MQAMAKPVSVSLLILPCCTFNNKTLTYHDSCLYVRTMSPKKMQICGGYDFGTIQLLYIASEFAAICGKL